MDCGLADVDGLVLSTCDGILIKEHHFLKQSPLTWYLENKKEKVIENEKERWEGVEERKKKMCLCRNCLEGSVLWHFLCSPWVEPRRSSWAAYQALLSQELSAVLGLPPPFSDVWLQQPGEV